VAISPLVSTTQAELVANLLPVLFIAVANFATGVIDIGGNLPPVSLTLWQICHWCRDHEFSKNLK
jgi:hypothetical protein